MSINTRIITLALIIITSTLNAQEIEWAKQISGIEYEYGIAVDTDENGNIYSVGYSTGTIIVEGDTINPIINGKGDAFIAKQDSNGNFIWVKTFGGDGNNYDCVTEIHVDEFNDIYILASVAGYNFHFGNDTIPEISAAYPRGAVLKIDSDGNVLWWENENIKSFEGIDTDMLGNVYITGYFNTTGMIGGQYLYNPAPGDTYDMVIAKFNRTGQLQWAKHVGGTYHNCKVFALEVSLNNSETMLYASGFFTNEINFETDTLNPGMARATYIVMYDTAGNEQWAKMLSNGASRTMVSLDISDDGKIGIAGFLTGSGTNKWSFIQQLDSMGNFLSELKPYSTSNSYFYGITYNSNNEYYTLGYYHEDLNLVDTMVSNSGPNQIVVKHSAEDSVIWVTTFPCASWQSYITDYPNYVIYTGRIDYPIYYNNGQDSIIPANGDAIIMKIKDCIGNMPQTPVQPVGPDTVCTTTDSISSYSTDPAVGAWYYEWVLTPSDAGILEYDSLTTNAKLLWSSNWEGQAEISIRCWNNCGYSAWSQTHNTWAYSCLGVIDAEKHNLDFELFPNPAYDILYFDIPVAEYQLVESVNNQPTSNLTMSIHDVYGKEIIEVRVNSNQFRINISALSSGIYFAVLKNEKSFLVRKKLIIR